MKKYRRYKIAVIILSCAVVLEGMVIFGLTRSKKPLPKARPAVTFKGKIAIVLDDWGYSLKNLGILEGIKYPLTLSVLPRLNYSAQVAGDLAKRGYEVILHLPMEPYERFRLEQNTILVSMGEQSIRQIIKEDLFSILSARGVSNHMGSRATSDTRTMSAVFKELKKRNLYFLDSLVSPKSVCGQLAKDLGLDFARRDIFLDNQQDPAYIKGQIYKLKALARMRGEAIGIGHDRKATLEVLKEVMPQLENEGYKFVYVSELVK